MIKINPGRKLDALVMVGVLGMASDDPRNDWSPSTDICAAWFVVEKMRELGFRFLLVTGSFYLEQPNGTLHSVDGLLGMFNAVFGKSGDRMDTIPADTAPHAICLAALSAVGIKDRISNGKD